MDSVTHTRIARILLSYVEETCGVTFDQSAFYYGNLKPDLTGTYLTKRHNPSVMYDEVMIMIREFTDKYTIRARNDRELSVDLGVICHYITDFFTYPHNDDIYGHNLFVHYVYEKRASARIGRRIDDDKFSRLASPIIPPFTTDALIARIEEMHTQYKGEAHHGITNDIQYICRVCALVVTSIISITYASEPAEDIGAIIATA